MALQPKFYASHAYPHFESLSTPPNVVDVYLDYACPFSAKLFINWYENLYPKLTKEFEGKIQIIFRNYVQVWHPVSNLLHEAGLAIAQIKPELFLRFSYELFKNIKEFYDTAVSGLSRNQTYELIYTKVVEPNFKEISKEIFLSKLQLAETTSNHQHSGNAVSNDLKFFTRVGRQNGVHVTPTVLVNGYKDGSIESSTPIDQVEAKFKALL